MVNPPETKEVKPIWKCRVPGCNSTAPPTVKGFNMLSGHQGLHSKAGVKKAQRGVNLIDENSGEILAESLSEATEKGLLTIEPLPAPGVVLQEAASTMTAEELAKAAEKGPKSSVEGVTKPIEEVAEKAAEEAVEKAIKEAEAAEEAAEAAVEPEEKQKGKEGEIKIPQASPEGILRYTITLPAEAFAMFNMAKACGLEPDKEMPFDEWMWDCIKKRFECDYKVQIVVAKLEGV